MYQTPVVAHTSALTVTGAETKCSKFGRCFSHPAFKECCYKLVLAKASSKAWAQQGFHSAQLCYPFIIRMQEKLSRVSKPMFCVCLWCFMVTQI